MAKVLPKVDVVTIGVGWTGGILAAELTKAGLTVVGLERGKARKTEDYYAVHDELRYSVRMEMMQDLSKETVTFRNKPTETSLPMRSHGSFLLGDGVGGSGSHWNGQCFRYTPYDFEIKSKTEARYGKEAIPADMALQDWGITYDELEPYYVKFEEMAGITGIYEGEKSKAWGPRSKPFPTAPMKETQETRLFKKSAKQLGWDYYHLPSANLSEQYKNPDGVERAGCQYCAYCERFGCEYGAKADPVVTVLPVAAKTGKHEIRVNSYVVEILKEGSKATGVRYIDTITGEEFIQPADIVAVTSYVFNNARLLLLSGLGKAYDANTGTGVVGKNYSYQTRTKVTGFFENTEFSSFIGAGGLGAVVDDFNADVIDHTGLGFLHGASIQLTQTGLRPIANNPVPNGTPSWGPKFKEESLKWYNKHITLTGEGCSLPYKQHYIDLDPTYKDAYGVPLARLTYDYEDQDRNASKFIAEKMETLLKDMGATHVDRKLVANYDIVPYQSTHNTGGVPMGNDPQTSAVNTYLQMHDHDNVFVVGASAFPHASGYNPTMTVGALAYRAAEGIVKYKQTGGKLV
jgi:gluconate 2-dehydrogenase alpha chain